MIYVGLRETLHETTCFLGVSVCAPVLLVEIAGPADMFGAHRREVATNAGL